MKNVERSVEEVVSTDSFDSLFAFTKENDGDTHLLRKETIAVNKEHDYINFKYPELITVHENKGPIYWHNLDSHGSETLSAIQSWIQADNIEISLLNSHDLHTDLLILRYLRANQFDLVKTKSHIVRSINWRKEMNVQRIVLQQPDEILGFHVEELTKVFPHWQSGYDKTGRPVLYKQYGQFDAGKIKKMAGGTFDRIIRYHIWQQEAIAQLCLEQSKKLHAIVETVSIVIDIKDMRLTQVNSDFITLTSILADIDGKQYPETLGRIFVINSSTSFSIAWHMVKPWVVPATSSKMKILGGPDEYIPVLYNFIGEENLPSNYGGKLPALTPQIHPYAEFIRKHSNITTPQNEKGSNIFINKANSSSSIDTENNKIQVALK